jgi:hypothetical protein
VFLFFIFFKNSKKTQMSPFLQVLILSAIASFTLCPALATANLSPVHQQYDDSNNATLGSLNATAFSLVDFYNIHNNSLRVGFEPFYWFTNAFVDLIKLSPLNG